MAAVVKNLRIGDVLKEYGYVNDEQIEKAMEYQKDHKGMRLGGALIAMNVVTEEQMLRALAARLELRYVEVSDLEADTAALEKLPRQMAQDYCMLPVAIDKNVMTVVMNDPMNLYGIEDVRQTVSMELDIWLARKNDITSAINYYYSEVDAKNAARKANLSFNYNQEPEENALDTDDDAPIVSLLNSLIERAYNIGASDIHIEPLEDMTKVRMRVDGAIIDYVTLRRAMHTSLITRIKILSDMDIAQRRLPQDGHFRIRMDGSFFNIRVSTIPTVFGEKAVLRLLVNNSVVDNQKTYGMNQEVYGKMSQMLRSPNGIIYVTGPTGSGKSTTLYMILEELVKKNVNISTIEDPVEKNIRGINQMQVNNTAGLTFEMGLRALLRQDPDILMIGETRDAETASIAVRAAITGHLVFSTLHTNDAASAVVRLADMGLERYMIASSVVGIVAQRLVRKICPECAYETELSADEKRFIGRPIRHVMKGRGCLSCSYTGYKGRTAVHEIMKVDGTLRAMITDGASTDEIKSYARSQGMKTLKESCIELVEAGVTTTEELMKVAYYE